MTMFYKILNGKAPSYLLDLVPEHISSNVSFRRNDIRPSFSRTNRYDNSIFPFCISNWNNLDSNIKSSSSFSLFKTNLNKFVRPKGNIFFSIRDRFGIKLLTKIRVCISDLRDHRFNHNFNCANPTCFCGFDDKLQFTSSYSVLAIAALELLILAKYLRF